MAKTTRRQPVKDDQVKPTPAAPEETTTPDGLIVIHGALNCCEIQFEKNPDYRKSVPDLTASLAHLLKLHRGFAQMLCQRQPQEPISNAEALSLRQLLHALEVTKRDVLALMGEEGPDPLSKSDHPDEALEKWSERQNKREQPLQFLERVWGNAIRAGLIFQADLRGQIKTRTNPIPRKGLDPTLYDEAKKQCRAEGLDLGQYLPNYRNRADKGSLFQSRRSRSTGHDDGRIERQDGSHPSIG